MYPKECQGTYQKRERKTATTPLTLQGRLDEGDIQSGK
jgi:hypothetical protein